MICGYARVSTKFQEREGNSLDAQETQLKAAGAKIVFTESYTGATLERPQLTELRHALEPGDTLMVTKLDRLARSASQGIAFIDDLLSHGISVHVLNMGLMDTSPTGKLIRSILLAFAEFERDMIVERTQEGRRLSGHYGGRPQKYSKEQIQLALSLLQDHSYKQVESMTGISVSTIYRATLGFKPEK
ncbi:recombinase family protein [Butyrivibrio sp. INlla21]|uniref:recombinase family protein n=1 Tax=Butyrivibrio sp. INlla21 TaxID=1520811 RepID=UPI0008F09DC7|nr:recombinase family protein [Butyrivibrio sp. INlla21]SFV03648.1 Site-specific DNA recombinase [Butyrivibrio sp. INlla21]